MKPLDKAFHVVPVANPSVGRRDLVHAPNEFVRIVPCADSWPHFILYCLLVVLSLASLLILTLWFPQVYTHLARQRLPQSSFERAHILLLLVHEDGFRSIWAEVKVNRPQKPRVNLKQRVRNFFTRGGGADGAESFTAIEKRDAKKHWIWFEFKKHRYAYNHDKGEYERYLASIFEDLSAIDARIETGLSETQQAAQRLELYGSNVVDIEKPQIAKLMFSKLMHPFYLFQVFSATVWFIEEYTVYAAVIIGLSALSLMWETYCEVSNTNRLHEMVRSDREVEVIRDNDKKKIHERDLVPGDIVVLAEEVVCADMLLLSGACEADEASITGEALPVTKAPVVGKGVITDFDARKQHKVSFLHAGSKITRVRKSCGECKAVVLNTGFSTGKGELFRSILYPRQLTFEFERDSYRYLSVLVAIAIAAFVKRVVDAAGIGNTFGYTIIHSLDLITIAVPPALPLVLSSGINFALVRLHQRGIACMEVRRINSCGQLTCFCFDKTGTLTEEALTFAGVEVVSESTQDLVATRMTDAGKLCFGMATCHELSADEQGYALDKVMFAATRCKLGSSADSNSVLVTCDVDSKSVSYEILRRFPFDARVQRSSVLIRNVETEEQFIWVKGSPEEIGAISLTIPANLDRLTRKYAAAGNYCIGFGVKQVVEGESLDLDNREQVESGLEFVGLARFANALKPESTAVVEELYGAGMDIRMITGDNPYTALHVGSELKMKMKSQIAVVDLNEKTGDVQLFDADPAKAENGSAEWQHFTGSSISRLLNTYDIAITGSALEKLRSECEDESIQHLLRNTLIFARIRPQQKTWIVEQLMDMGQIVGMCGDGTNDCGALKAAHVGFALLSGVEASIIAPFTSKDKSILDVPVLIREGRCAIMTSFLAFKFMVLYPLIQLAMATTLAHFDLVLSNNQYVWDDMAIVLGLSITMLYTGASEELLLVRPPRTLFSPTIVCSIVGQIAIFLTFFAGNFVLLKDQTTSWFCRIQDGMAYLSGDRTVPDSCAIYLAYNSEDNAYSYEDTAVWLFGHMLYISVAAAFNIKDPFRLPFYTNKSFTALLVVVLGVNLWFMLDTSGVVDDTFQLMPMPFDYRWKMLVMFVGHFFAAILWELLTARVLAHIERPEWVQRLSASCNLF